MCAIVDASVVGEVFGSRSKASARTSSAGKKFLEWVNKGTGRLIVGGELLKELHKASEDFRKWGRQALLSGVMRRENEHKVTKRTEELQAERGYGSNDPHVLALAQVSGARLLYSNDGELQQDFKKKRLIDNPRGKVYSTREHRDFSSAHKRLLADKNLCRVAP